MTPADGEGESIQSPTGFLRGGSRVEKPNTACGRNRPGWNEERQGGGIRVRLLPVCARGVAPPGPRIRLAAGIVPNRGKQEAGSVFTDL